VSLVVAVVVVVLKEERVLEVDVYVDVDGVRVCLRARVHASARVREEGQRDQNTAHVRRSGE
jgi:hypothetical protein